MHPDPGPQAALPALPPTVSMRHAGPELGQFGRESLAGGATAAASWYRPSYSGWVCRGDLVTRTRIARLRRAGPETIQTLTGPDSDPEKSNWYPSSLVVLVRVSPWPGAGLQVRLRPWRN